MTPTTSSLTPTLLESEPGPSLAASLATVLAAHPVWRAQIASYSAGHYGAQIHTPTTSGLSEVIGSRKGEERGEPMGPGRVWQLNKFATAGVCPDGSESGFRVDYMRKKAVEQVEAIENGARNGVEEGVTQDTLPAAHQAAFLRGHQFFHDGNHRTSLLLFASLLACAEIIVMPDFDWYRAYLVLSARTHPGNRDNFLDDTAITETGVQLARYARRRVERGRVTEEYWEKVAEKVRELPVRVSVAETIWTGLQRVGKQERTKLWAGLEEGVRRDITLAHGEFKAG